MFGLGPTELVVILVLALLVLGPQKIPEAATSLGKAIRGFRRATRELRDQIDLEDDVRRPLEDLRSALHDEPASNQLMRPAVKAEATAAPPAAPVKAEAAPAVGVLSPVAVAGSVAAAPPVEVAPAAAAEPAK